MDYKELKSYMELSPFEVQFALTNIAGNFRDHTLLNAGRGNPNWIATTPRQAFFTLGNFAIEESKCNCEYIHTGFHPEKPWNSGKIPGICKRKFKCTWN